MQNVAVMPLSKDEAEMVVQLFRIVNASVVIPEATTEASPEEIRGYLASKIDTFMSSFRGDTLWFVKTNRHSCKDSPLDHPLQSDILLFAEEMSNIEIPPLDISLDDLDFGPCFGAMCRARIKAIAVRNGDMVVSLLERSRRIHDDFSLQLDICPEPWDCYLAFSPFSDSMARYPLHEFRCYVSRRQLRCISQYSYLVTCPIACELMPYAVKAMAKCIEEEIIPTLADSIIDAAVDIQCVPLLEISPNREDDYETSAHSFVVNVIEINPLGPGTVWGHLHWESDKNWLLGDNFSPLTSSCVADISGIVGDVCGSNCILPKPRNVCDSVGNEKCVQWYKRDVKISSPCGDSSASSQRMASSPTHQYELVTSPESDNITSESILLSQLGGDVTSRILVVLFTSKHASGTELGALAHIPADYLVEVWRQWRIEERPPASSVMTKRAESDIDVTSSMLEYCRIS